MLSPGNKRGSVCLRRFSCTGEAQEKLQLDWSERHTWKVCIGTVMSRLFYVAYICMWVKCHLVVPQHVKTAPWWLPCLGRGELEDAQSAQVILPPFAWLYIDTWDFGQAASRCMVLIRLLSTAGSYLSKDPDPLELSQSASWWADREEHRPQGDALRVGTTEGH